MSKNDKSEPTLKKIYRSRNDRVIFGVCGGLGEYFKIDATIFRIIFLLLFICGATGLILYLLLAIIIPKDRSDRGLMEQGGDFSTNLKIKFKV